MPDYKIVFTPTDARAVEWPEDVKYEGRGFDKNGRVKQLAYEQACREAIEKGVRFKSLATLQHLVTGLTGQIALNKPYNVPEGFEIKITGSNSCRYSKCDCASYDECFDAMAELVPVQPKEESQEALWQEFWEAICAETPEAWFKENFIIKRK